MSRSNLHPMYPTCAWCFRHRDLVSLYHGDTLCMHEFKEIHVVKVLNSINRWVRVSVSRLRQFVVRSH